MMALGQEKTDAALARTLSHQHMTQKRKDLLSKIPDWEIHDWHLLLESKPAR